MQKPSANNQLVAEKLARLKLKEAYLAAKRDPSIPNSLKNANIREIEKLCGEIEIIVPNIKKLIKRFSVNIRFIDGQDGLTATYLLMGKMFSNLESMLLLCRHGKNFEVMELYRSGKESWDLATLFLEDSNKDYLAKWLKGDIVKNFFSRNFQHSQMNTSFSKNTPEEELPVNKMLSYGYGLMSNYTHSGYLSLLESVDVFNLDLDFDSHTGYHYCVENFTSVRDLVIKILLLLKQVFGVTNDVEGFQEADRLVRPYIPNISLDVIKQRLNRYKEPPFRAAL